MRGRDRPGAAGQWGSRLSVAIFASRDMLFFNAMKELHRLPERPDDRPFRDDGEAGVETRALKPIPARKPEFARTI